MLKDICHNCGLSKQTVNSALRKLEKEGIVYLESVDSRHKKVCLTEEGKSLAGRTAGAVIEAEGVEDASGGREDLKGSVMAKLQKKLLVNTVTVLFDLLGRTNNKEAVAQSGAYLSGALYQMFRLLYRAAGGNEGYFSTGSGSFNMDIVSADMTLARVKYAKALEEYRGEYPPVDSQSLAEEYQGLSQSMAQVFHSTDERVKKLEE